MNHSASSLLHSPNDKITESNQFIINGTMLGVLCLMAICVVVLFCYYIAWALQHGRDAEQASRTNSSSQPSDLMRVPVFVPHTFPVTLSYPTGSSDGLHQSRESMRKAEREKTPPPPSYESIFPSGRIVETSEV